MQARDRHPLWILAGGAVWALHFGTMYGYTAYACSRGEPHGIDWAIGVATLVAALATIALALDGHRRRASFNGWMTASVASAALLAIVWEGATVLPGVAPCGLR